MDDISLNELTYLDPHPDLDSESKYFYLEDYIGGRGFQESKTNSDILNLKKSLEYKDDPHFIYKAEAIELYSNKLNNALGRASYQDKLSWIPIPPSKSKSNPFYDDRLIQLLDKVDNINSKNIVELIINIKDHTPAHTSEKRHSKDEIKSFFSVDDNLLEQCSNKLILFDDVITNGTHFMGCKDLIHEKKPDAIIYGVFLARRVIQNGRINVMGALNSIR